MKYISIEDAEKTTWMILKGLGYKKEENPELKKIVLSVFDTAPCTDVQPVKRGCYEATQFEALFSTRVCSDCFNRVPIGHFCYMCGVEMSQEAT